jgi:hypothetical protein
MRLIALSTRYGTGWFIPFGMARLGGVGPLGSPYTNPRPNRQVVVPADPSKHTVRVISTVHLQKK